MKYRIREVSGWFFPEYKGLASLFFWTNIGERRKEAHRSFEDAERAIEEYIKSRSPEKRVTKYYYRNKEGFDRSDFIAETNLVSKNSEIN